MDERDRLADALAAEVDRTAFRHRVETFMASRDAGRAITRDALKRGITLKAVVEVAADTARYADAAIDIIKDEYHPRLDCKEDCWYCCSKPGVLASIPELLRILVHVRSAWDADAVAALAERARQYVQQLGGRDFNDLVNESVPCPLLVEGRCSVYAFRPLTCRGYNSTSVEACRNAHDNAELLVPMFALLKDATDGTTVGAAQSLESAGFNTSLVDLGSALNIALSAGAEFPDAVIGGNEALLPAEDASFLKHLWAEVCETARRVGLEP